MTWIYPQYNEPTDNHLYGRGRLQFNYEFITTGDTPTKTSITCYKHWEHQDLPLH